MNPTYLRTLFIVVVLPFSVHAQELASAAFASDAATLSKAEDAMTQFGNRRRSLPKSWAVYSRADNWDFEQKRGSFSSVDYFMLSAFDGPKSSLFYCVRTKIRDSGQSSRIGKGALSMVLVKDGRTIVRKGTDGQTDAKISLDKEGKVEKTGKTPAPHLGPFDFFSFPVSDYTSFQLQKTREDIVWEVYMAPTSKLLLAAETPIAIVGAWQIGHCVAVVEFDKKYELLPTSVIWRMKPNDAASKDMLSGRVLSATRTNWCRLKAKSSGTEIFVPWHFQCESPGISESSDKNDLEMICEWKFEWGVKEIIPKVEDESWMKPSVALFNRDPGEDFAKFKRDVVNLYGTKSIKPIRD